MELTRSQKEIQKAARDFARGEFDKDLALEMDNRGEFPLNICKKAAHLGFIGLHWPEAYEGGGLGLLETVLVTEAFCRQDSTLGCALSLTAWGADCLLDAGPDALKQKFLPQVVRGDICAAMACLEPGVQEKWTTLQTTASRDNGHWRISGCKQHVLGGVSAEIFIVLARTAADEMSMLLVERDRKGVDVRHSGRKLGLNLTGTAELRLDEVRVPAGHLIGKAGAGAALLERFMMTGCILLAAQALGIAAGSLDRAQAYVKSREAFDRRLADFEITRHKIGDMAVRVETARLAVYHAALQPGAVTAAIAKMSATRAAVAVADEAIQLFGGYGYMKESAVERFFRDAKTLELMLGGPRALKKTIADAVIGKR